MNALNPKIVELAKQDKRVFADPEPKVIATISNLSVSLDLRFWCTNDDYWDVLADMNKKVYDFLVEADVQLPYSKINVVDKQNERE